MSDMDVYSYFEQLDRENIMISFKGDLNKELLDAILSVVEEKLEAFDAPSVTRKKVFNVMVECLQNLYHHRNKNEETLRDSAIIIMVAKNATGYSVFTGNFVQANVVDNLKSRIQEINSLDRKELKELYRQVLTNGQFSDKGGGGLGIIDIAKKSGEKLDYGFMPVDDFNSFFSLNVSIPNKT